jgi:hypothetical protein
MLERWFHTFKVPVYESSSERVFPEQALPQMATTIFMAITHLRAHTYIYAYHDACTDVDFENCKYVSLGCRGCFIRYRTGTHRRKPINFGEISNSLHTNPILASIDVIDSLVDLENGSGTLHLTAWPNHASHDSNDDCRTPEKLVWVLNPSASLHVNGNMCVDSVPPAGV